MPMLVNNGNVIFNHDKARPQRHYWSHSEKNCIAKMTAVSSIPVLSRPYLFKFSTVSLVGQIQIIIFKMKLANSFPSISFEFYHTKREFCCYQAVINHEGRVKKNETNFSKILLFNEKNNQEQLILEKYFNIRAFHTFSLKSCSENSNFVIGER